MQSSIPLGRFPVGSRSHVIPSSHHGGAVGTKQISKIVMTKSGQRFPVVAAAGKSVSELVQAKHSIANGLSSGHNRHIITSADGVKRLRTATGMEIISSLPTKLPQDTVVSVESSPRVGAVYHRVTAMGNHHHHTTTNTTTTTTSSSSASSLSSAVKSGNGTAATNLVVELLERQLLELKKLTEDLRKQFDLSQKQNEEYRTRVDKLEKEVQMLKQQHGSGGGTVAETAAGSLVEIL